MDIVRFLQDYNVPFWLEGKNVSPGWVGIQCPLCADVSNHGGFCLTGSEPYYNCWKCGWSPLEKVIAKLAGTTRPQASHLIELYAGKSRLPELEIEPKPLIIPGGPLQSIHRDYLSKRNFNPDYLADKYQIKGTGPLGDFRFRLVIPITYEKIEVSFHTRDITDKAQLRYKACPKNQELIHHKHIFYGLDFIQDVIVIVEGPLDVWRIGDGAIASFGTTFTQAQIELLVAIKPKRIYTLFDSGKLEAKQSQKLTTKVGSFEGIKVYRIDLKRGDPCDLTHTQVTQLRKEVGI